MLAQLRTLSGFADLKHKESAALAPPFPRLRIRLKKEIVTLGRPDILPHRKTGTYVSGEEWNRLIEDPDVLETHPLALLERTVHGVRLEGLDPHDLHRLAVEIEILGVRAGQHADRAAVQSGDVVDRRLDDLDPDLVGRQLLERVAHHLDGALFHVECDPRVETALQGALSSLDRHVRPVDLDINSSWHRHGTVSYPAHCVTKPCKGLRRQRCAGVLRGL